ncbi:MAG: GIY-YIG nuclease family protein [Candidatus Kuenenbacteria bacterium]
MAHVYILQSDKDNKYYIGSTTNLTARLERHFTGRSKATKHRLPLRLVYSKEFETKSEAIKFEYYLKSLKSHYLITELIHGSVLK